MNPFLIDLRNLPAEGMHREGTLPASFFDLPADDPIKPVSPLSYSLDIQRDDDEVIAQGEVSADFTLQCGRCAETFGYRLEVPDFVTEAAIEKEQTIDLTAPLREDILLALPSYPRCEDGNIHPRACPAEGRFTEAAPSDEPPAEDKGIWDALDQLKR